MSAFNAASLCRALFLALFTPMLTIEGQICSLRKSFTSGGRGARIALHGKPPTAFVGAVGDEDEPERERAAGSTHLRRRRATPARLCSDKAEVSCWRTTARAP